MSAGSESASSAPIDISALPPDQSPAVSEDTFMRLEKQRPQHSAPRTSIPRSRPSDITVTEPATNYIDPSQYVDPRSTPADQPGSLRQTVMTPPRSSSPFGTFRTGSPRHLSPATSQIFERDVQESVIAPELSPAIPSHLATEDQIPPVLEASSEVITNDRLNPEEVEIVTHAAHQPAASSVMGDSQSFLPINVGSDAGNSPDTEEVAHSYGEVDPLDPRRLSFISFADVVHAEQAEQADAGKEPSMHLGSPGSLAASMSSGPAAQQMQPPSPVRSPDPATRAPLSPASMSTKDGEISPVRVGSIQSGVGHGTIQGELNVETLAQTIQKTGSNDMGASVGTLV